MRPSMRIRNLALLIALFAVPILAACGGGGSAPPPFLALATQQAASVVIGQVDFDGILTNQGLGLPAANTMNYPAGQAAFFDGRLYLPDGQGRLLVFDGIPAANDASATLVLGQATFATSGSGNAADQFETPAAVAVGSGKLAVADEGNSRVLIWNSLPTLNGQAADVVVGQAGFGVPSLGCTQELSISPKGVAIVDGRLLVADTDNRRVLIWNTIPTTNGAPADLVLGQDAFDECIANDLDHNGLADDGGDSSATTMNSPRGLWSDGTRLIVADSSNHRVLIWNSFPTVNAQPADVVVGQSDFASHGFGTTQGSLDDPSYVTSNGSQLFVSDYNNHRVLIWNTVPTSNGAPADVVLGQPDFATNTPATSGGNTGLNYPSGVLASGAQLLVPDSNNHRVLAYQGQ